MFKPTTRRSRRPRLRARVLAAVVVVFAVAPMAATAGVYAVSGDQVAIDESSSTMTGGLKGTWTSFVADYRFDEATGRIVAWGTETFAGCLDRRLNGCDASDAQGTLSFKFVAWQKLDPQNGYAFVSGACIHPVTGGTGGLSGARGVITMKDTLQADGSVSTTYRGLSTIRRLVCGRPRRAAAAEVAAVGEKISSVGEPSRYVRRLRVPRRITSGRASVRPDGLLPQCSRMRENRPMGSGVQPTRTRIAGYEIEELIGRGGMGEVYRALDPSLERPVALKLLLPNLAEDAGFRERMLRESRLAASLDHPNVVPIYEAGDADGRLFIAMRYVDGTDLKTLLRRTARSSRPVPSQSRPRSQMHSTQPMHRGSCTGMSSPQTSCLTSREGASTHTLPISDRRRVRRIVSQPTEA